MIPVKTIITEEHSSQLHVWSKLGLTNATVIYLDAHLDLQYISPERIEKLKKCQTTEEIAKLEKPDHMLPDRGYSYSIEDFLYAAHHLEMIDHLIWVYPQQKKEFKSPLDGIRFLQNLEGFSMEDFNSFEVVNNILKANLMGLDITICEYQDLKNLELPENTLIDIDIDYFIRLPQDRPWIAPKKVFETLKELSIQSDYVTVTRSVSSGYMPLRYRFIADYFAALFANNQSEIEHYDRLFQLDEKAQEGDTDIAHQGCLAEITKFPNCAATYYLLSLCERDRDKAAEYRSIAAKLCPVYRPNVLRSANAIISRDLKINKTVLEKLETQLQKGEYEENELPMIHFTLGFLSANLGDFQRTVKHYQILQNMQLDSNPRLSLILAELSLKEGNEDRALTFLEEAVSEESTKPEAHTMLGSIYLKQEQYSLAKEHLVQATQMLPTAKKPAKLLTEVYQKIGDKRNHRIQLSKYQQMKLLIP